jgi:crotonobetainyl-CoA:carnitine CoA-transferase CaiB-like acyl-CoA transferase
MRPGPLHGVLVVELANWVAAPSAGALLSDLGARVIKIEPPGGDPMRALARQPEVAGDRARTNYAFQGDNRGKRSITLDLDRPGAAEVVARLCRDAEIFISNLTPERQERFHLTPEDLWRTSPRLVFASLTGYGLTGPEANNGGFDNAAYYARSGISSLTGEPGSPPPRFRTGTGDHVTALGLVAATLAAMRVRDETGEGQVVDVSLFGTAIWALGQDFSAALVDGRQPPRSDNRLPANPIANAYECRDGRWVVLTMGQSDRYWPAFCRAMGRPDLIDHPRFATHDLRRQHTEELTALIAALYRGNDRAAWAKRMDGEGLIWAPVQELPEVVRDPQARAIGIFAEVDHPVVGRFETVASPWRIRDADISVRGPAPEAGEHTHEVLREFGFEDAEIAALAVDGVFG